MSSDSRSQFLDAFTKLRNATISFVMSVRPSARLSVYLSVRMEQLSSHCTDVREISGLRIFRKSFEKIQVSLKSDGYFT